MPPWKAKSGRSTWGKTRTSANKQSSKRSKAQRHHLIKSTFPEGTYTILPAPVNMHPCETCENGRYGSRDQVIDDADATVTSKGANARSIRIPALDATTPAATATMVMKS
ncbi:MAG: hypothetical protein DMG76_19185 [Acidobacteria bacterium]|nr:MAG: hypothetical protein DMG76_19185 [Acidobacteriota bacterium]